MTRGEAIGYLGCMIDDLSATVPEELLPPKFKKRIEALQVAIDALIKDRDTEELVYCKDCGRSETEECQIQNALYGLGDYDFCSYGWRKGANE